MGQIIVGLDIGHYSVKAIRLDVSYRGFEALGYDEQILDSVEVDPEHALLEAQEQDEPQEGGEDLLLDALHDAEDEAIHTALLELRERGALNGDLICVAIPPDLTLASKLRFPFTDERQLQAVIPADFEDESPVSVSDLILRHHVVGPSVQEEGMYDVIVNGLKEEDLEIFLDLWRVGDVDPHFVEPGDMAMLRLAPTLLPELEEPYAIVDIGHRFTRVVCVEKLEEGWAPGYARSFQYGGQDVTRLLAEMLSCTAQDAEHFKHRRAFVSVATLAHGMDEVQVSDAIKRSLSTLTRELRRTFQAHMDERRTPITQIFVCGGGSRLRGLSEYLQEQSVCRWRLCRWPTMPWPAWRCPNPELTVQALSLALREAPLPGADVDLNFRVGRFGHKAAKGWFRERLMGLVVIGALLLCALGSLFGSKYFAASQQYDASRAALESATERLFGEKITREKKVKDLLGGGGDESSIIPKHSAHDYFYEVYKSPPKGMKLELAEVDVDLFRQLIKSRLGLTLRAMWIPMWKLWSSTPASKARFKRAAPTRWEKR